MFDGRNILVSWLTHLFNPPPLTTLTQAQKIARSFLVALTLFILCIAAATLGALGLYLFGHARQIVSDQATIAGFEIVLVAVLVDVLCLRAILAIKRRA